MGFPDCPQCRILKLAQKFVKARVIQDEALLKTFFESAHEFHAGKKAGRSTAVFLVVLPEVVRCGFAAHKGAE